MRLVLVLAVVAWGGAVLLGLGAMRAYATTPGALAAPPARWPAGTRVGRVPGLPTIVLFAHPECPCTRASLGELAAVVRAVGARASVAIVDAGAPTPPPPDLAGAAVVGDPDGREAARFGAQTSGFVVVYRADGALAFAGGITGSRGHAGDNVGRREVIAAVLGPVAAASEHAVFGCALAAPEPVPAPVAE